MAGDDRFHEQGDVEPEGQQDAAFRDASPGRTNRSTTDEHFAREVRNRKGETMSQHAGAHGRLAKFRAWIARVAADRRGVAAIEFALVAPLLLCMYFVTMEVSQAIETNKKVSRIGSMVADLVTQQQTTTKSEVDAIMQIGQSLLHALLPLEAHDHHHGDRDHRRDDAEGQGVLVAQADNGATSAGRCEGHDHHRAGGTEHARVVPGSRRERPRLQAGHHLGRRRTSRRSAWRRPSTTSR